MRKKKVLKIAAAVVFVLFLLYVIFIYFLVSACLVPSFMRKLDAFEDITVMGYSEQVHSTEISEHHAKSMDDADTLVKDVESRKVSLQSEDGYKLVAEEFSAKEESGKWVMLLHGYTGWKEEMFPFAYWYYEQGYHVLVPDLRCQGESEGDFIGMGWTDHSACLMLRLRGGYDLNDASAVNAVKKSRTPTLFIHGDEDAMVSVDMVYELFKEAACDKELLVMEGAGHAQSQDKDPSKYYGTIAEFLEKNGMGDS